MPSKAQTGASEPVYFLLHIPKTAGQTIQVHLAEHCAPGVFWQSQRRLRPGRGATPADFPDVGRARVISGHHIGRSLEAFFPRREVRRIVLLRDPIKLQLSFYNWKMMDHVAKGLGTYSFELHLKSLPRNFISHFLLSRWLEMPWHRLITTPDDQKYALLNKALAQFWFVGTHSDCDRIAAAISCELGIPPVAQRRNSSAEAHAHTGWQLLTEKSLSRETYEAMRVSDALDQRLWDSWKGAGFEPAKIRPIPLASIGSRTGLAREAIRPWYRFRRYILREWVGRRPPSAAIVDHANLARDTGDWQVAASRYREALRVIPNAPAIWVQYGHALKESGHLPEAEQAYRRAYQLNPGIADTHLQLGHALKLQGRNHEAEDAYLRAAALDPTLADPPDELVGLGWTAHRIARAIAASQQEATPSSDSPDRPRLVDKAFSLPSGN